ncbi:MAG: serine/threonine protein kinase, partial [Planctomycetaceae bacterium]|nr:serine/threonine protein kinase [Planctomycetaceae bacterium]
MATFDRPKSTEKPPADLLAVIRSAGILTDRQLGEIRTKVLRGEYPVDPIALAEQLVKDDVLTVYQARRFLSNKAHGLLVGRYIILDRIGSGSMGRVYKAHHQMMDRVVALKIIAPEIAMNERVVARFQREMRLVGRLDHPNVVRAFDADQVNTVLYIVMEYVPGISLGERLKKGPIPAQQMFDYAAQAALGLAHAHDQGMVHRDIKPSNMLLTEDRKIKILDLGLGVLMEADTNTTFATADGIAVGTVDYMSPEQALGKEVDGRSDLFSLGCAMFHLMTGKPAFPGDSPIDRLGGRISGRPVPITKYLPDLPASAVRVLGRMLAFKPEDRFSTAREAADALQSTIRPRTRPAGSSRPAPTTANR